MSTIDKIDSILSYIPRTINEKGREMPSRRILYFRSENRQILKDAIDYSSYLWELICPEEPELPKGQRYAFLEEKKCVREFTETAAPFVRVYLLTDFHAYQDERGLEKSQLGMIKRFLDQPIYKNALLLIASPYVQIPLGFDDEVELFNLGSMDVEDIKEVMLGQLKTRRDLDDRELEAEARKFLGLSRRQILSVMEKTSSLGYSNELDALQPKEKEACRQRTAQEITQEKKNLMEKDPAIEFVEYAGMEEAAGMDDFNAWIQERQRIFEHPEEAMLRGVKMPNGVMLTGIPGTGKTMIAKKTAKAFGNLPLIKFQLQQVQSSLYGGSSANLQRYLSRIESMAPCVMLVDEVDKALQNNKDTHEATRLMISQILTWLQENQGKVFAFFCANDVTGLPPELMRPGRLSERFFVFMPNFADLCGILDSKLQWLDQQMFDEGMQQAIREKLVGREIMTKIGQRMGNRALFFTGADLEVLLREVVNLKLWLTNTPMPYSKEVYVEMVVDCACSGTYKSTGETNMNHIVKTWYSARENKFRNVSKLDLFPFDALVKGRRLPERPELDNDYDKKLYAGIGKAIVG
ncbi:MAG: AAA family ATPase [Firmicutes bacterium]|nr:AAA family ATPase [Bacillota bacterium]